MPLMGDLKAGAPITLKIDAPQTNKKAATADFFFTPGTAGGKFVDLPPGHSANETVQVPAGAQRFVLDLDLPPKKVSVLNVEVRQGTRRFVGNVKEDESWTFRIVA